ncbi:MAG TPA: hypothetical protein VM347_03935 [Nonomuraea sp.]|nr:hypothetical protein [Nonomuraea sp.]
MASRSRRMAGAGPRPVGAATADGLGLALGKVLVGTGSETVASAVLGAPLPGGEAAGVPVGAGARQASTVADSRTAAAMTRWAGHGGRADARRVRLMAPARP